MGLTCIIGFHSWDGCKCSSCGKTRDKLHDWSHDCNKCSSCGKTRNGAHNWYGCKCSSCGITRDEEHKYEPTYTSNCEAKCTKCGKPKYAEGRHDWSRDCEECSICRQYRSNAHIWDGCKCTVCGKIIHKSKTYKQGYKCEKCGELEFIGWETWLLVNYGNVMPKRLILEKPQFGEAKKDRPQRFEPDLAEFVLSQGVTGREMLMKKYRDEAARFINRED